jgi:hypothetical protein
MQCSPELINSNDNSSMSSNIPDIFSDSTVDDSSESVLELDSSGNNSDNSDNNLILDEEEE